MNNINIDTPNFGTEIKWGGITKTIPKKWTNEEVDFILKAKENGCSNIDIAKKLDRSEVSISIKLKRLKKKDNTYNAGHVIEKYKTNSEFVSEIEPKCVLDLFCGEKNFYETYPGVSVFSNDKNTSIPAASHADALKCLCELYSKGQKFDLVDLDPYGSAFDCFDLAIKMAKKGIVITFGELGHKRFKRLDYVRHRYGIDNIENFTLDKLIAKVQEIGAANKKRLIVSKRKEWQNIGRVWFAIEPIKITEQWETGQKNEKEQKD